MNDNGSGESNADQPKRRDVIAAVAKLGAVTAVLGVGTPARAANERGEKLNKLLWKAVDTGDMEAAISQYGGSVNLTRSEEKALLSLSSSELNALGSIISKLSPIGRIGVVCFPSIC